MRSKGLNSAKNIYIVIIVIFSLVSCKKDPSPPDDANFSQSSTSVTAEFDETIINFDVVSNSSWVAKSDQTWCTVNQKAGRNNTPISASFSENNTNSARVAKITISNVNGISQVVTLTQNGLFVTDIDGNIYKTVKIGTQYWLDKNLCVTKYSNGDAIPNVTDNEIWGGLTTGAYCNYNNDSNNALTYGRLFNWYAVTDSRNIAPTGWHVPTDAEWTILTDYLGCLGVAGGKLKETGTAHWVNPNTGATNETGFSALPGGCRYYDIGTFWGDGEIGNWWSSTEYPTSNIWSCYRYIDNGNSQVFGYSAYKATGFSVRCLRD
jgi:uncharacterized protein (TIGR02145 family)